MTSIFNSYFGAANSFSGFSSCFNEIFSPKKFARIYVLKGGPGTGKSSLMKKIAFYFKNENFAVDKIYCSSDPNSLDGVIIYSENKKIAVLDGTAPHETDAKIPGAVDEIINLGKAWDRNSLIKRRNEIEVLNQKKRISYEKAYKYLKHAGHFFEEKFSITSSMFDYTTAIDSIESISNFKTINHGRNITKRLISSFSKYGYKRIELEKLPYCEQIHISGRFTSQYIFMNCLKNELTRRNADIYFFPSPYSDKFTEAIYVKDINVFIDTNTVCEKEINSNDFIDKSILSDYYDLLLNFEENTNKFLGLSVEEFKKASDAHFLLEEIYTPSMNFKTLDMITQEIIYDIMLILNDF